jgi:ABC-2 type transport system permease protein
MASEARGLLYLARLTMYRQLLARKSVIAGVLVSLLVLGVYAWNVRRVPEILTRGEQARIDRAEEEEAMGVREGGRRRREASDDRPMTAEERVRHEFALEIVMLIFVGMLTPLLTLIYATSAFADEREDRTLVYLLTRPLGRWRIYLAKAAGVTPVVLAVVIGSLGLVCLVAGEPGRAVFTRFLPGVALGSVAYTSVFLLFGAIAPRPLIMSVVYAFLVEGLVVNMPGTLKRIAISYHTRCLLYHAGSDLGLGPENARHFSPISAEWATGVLVTLIVILLAWGAIAFQRREYRDLG